jgi:predicted secreted Zn-dependent protease
VFQCREAGRLVFTDKPCAGADGSQLKVGGGGAQGSIEFEVPVRHYTVSAPNLQQAVRVIRASNPGGFWGFARWKVGYKYQTDEKAGNCTIRQVTLRVQGDILMPDWVEERQATTQEQGAWRTMYASLKRHEDGHVQHGREFALLLKERLLGIGSVPCAELAERAGREYQMLYANLRKRDEDYDFRTEHGLRQDNPR